MFDLEQPWRYSLAMSDGRRYDFDDEDEDEHRSHDGERQRLFERALPEVIKRLVEGAVEKGVETLTEGPENLRNYLGELKLPKEAVQYIYQQIDDTKKGVYRVVAKEIRDVLEHTNLSDEIADVLTKLSFEISTQIRFVPNPAAQDDDEDGDGDESKGGDGREGKKRGSRIPKPNVVSKVVMRARDAFTKD